MTILIITEKGLVIRFNPNQIRIQSRGGKGVRAIRLAPDDKVVGIVTQEKED